MKPPTESRAFTLIEMVLSLAIASVLALAVNAAIYIATRSIPTRGDAMSTSSDLLFLDDALRTDLELATAVISSSATSVEFEVPDRTGDDVPERIELDWVGNAGDPLQQRVNSGSWSPVVGQVQDMKFSVTNVTKSGFAGTQSPVPTPVTIDARFTNGGWSPVRSGKQIAIQVDPSVEADSVWRMTGVDLYLQWDGSRDGDLLEVSAGKDVHSVSDTWRHTLLELGGGEIKDGGEWMTFPLRTPWLAHDENVKVRLLNKAGDTSFNYQIKNLTPMPAGLLLYYDIFNNWSPVGLTAIAMEVRYETMPVVATEADALAIKSLKLEMGFGTGVSDAVLNARPIAKAEDQR